MTDMPAFDPDALIHEVIARQQKGLQIHTLVLWTKHVQSLFREPINNFLIQLKESGTQLYVHLTITGMAQKQIGIGYNNEPVILEPGVPLTEQTIEKLQDLITLTGKAERIKLRIDPLIKISDTNQTVYSNYAFLEEIIQKTSHFGIKNFTFSFLEKGVYKKVDNRFAKKGLTIISPNEKERIEFSDYIRQLEKKYLVTISACCVPGIKTSRCIDGYELEKLHDRTETVSKKEPKSRIFCGCTESIDIGGWPPKICPSGCLYCYARPKFKNFVC
jgi:hypothetical protein